MKLLVPYFLEVSPEFKADYQKFCSKNAAFRQAVDKKITQVLEMPLHYKPLRAPLQGVRRAHVFSSFVLLFSVIESTRVVRFLRLAHHDEAY